jgi:TonB family protein
MKSGLALILLSGALAAVQPGPCAAALEPSDELTQDAIQVRQQRRALPRIHVIPARQILTEEQALHALETEISRKVGLHMREDDYPEEARRWTWSGTTLVQVQVGRDGMMRQVCVGRTSGFRILDEQAVRVVSRISSPSWIPDRLRGREVTVNVPIGFIRPPRAH